MDMLDAASLPEARRNSWVQELDELAAMHTVCTPPCGSLDRISSIYETNGPSVVQHLRDQAAGSSGALPYTYTRSSVASTNTTTSRDSRNSVWSTARRAFSPYDEDPDASYSAGRYRRDQRPRRSSSILLSGVAKRAVLAAVEIENPNVTETWKPKQISIRTCCGLGIGVLLFFVVLLLTVTFIVTLDAVSDVLRLSRESQTSHQINIEKMRGDLSESVSPIVTDLSWEVVRQTNMLLNDAISHAFFDIIDRVEAAMQNTIRERHTDLTVESERLAAILSLAPVLEANRNSILGFGLLDVSSGSEVFLFNIVNIAMGVVDFERPLISAVILDSNYNMLNSSDCFLSFLCNVPHSTWPRALRIATWMNSEGQATNNNTSGQPTWSPIMSVNGINILAQVSPVLHFPGLSPFAVMVVMDMHITSVAIQEVLSANHHEDLVFYVASVDGNLVASTHTATSPRVMNALGIENVLETHSPLSEADNPIVRVSSAHLGNALKNLSVHTSYRDRFEVNGTEYLLDAMGFGRGDLLWLAVTVLPAGPFFKPVTEMHRALAVSIANMSRQVDKLTRETQQRSESRVRFSWIISIGAAVAVLLSAIFASILISTAITRPLFRASAALRRASDLHFDNDGLHATLFRETTLLNDAYVSMPNAMKSFVQYVPKDIVIDILRRGQVAKVGLRKVELTVMFINVREFTVLSEELSAQTLVDLMSEYLEVMSDILCEYGGTIDKYIGDGIMAFFNEPRRNPMHANAALVAALACRVGLKVKGSEWARKNWPRLGCRMGIHTGPAQVGNVGSSTRLNYTAIGDSVNLASRLVNINKLYGTTILASSDTLDAARPGCIPILTREIDTVIVSGKTEATEIHEIMALKSCARAADLVIADNYDQAMAEFRVGNVVAAKGLWESCNDSPSKVMLQRCKEILSGDKKWSATWKCTTK
eukprot:NODE_28_length_3097_cov_256.922572_g24_i0.p1 GENE.NODE_28_length_3097_cov_256.922572_g24_i0~~NODE_28_length_3097_cov_256.922572_g24_i0.p1  ORF type:complete len:936 (+),score=181.22 NODE_28_length_3097_cov_256.922572_g24_i0:175-2982(+)